MPTKAVAAGGTVGLAGSLSVVLFWAIGHPAPPEIEGAMTTIISAVLTFMATYFTKAEETK